MNEQEDQIPGAEVPNTSVAVNDPQLREFQQREVVTPAQARIEAVADALKAAYAKASELKLTPEEASALAEDFPDEAFRQGAGGDPDLIYIEHAYLRQRLNKVLGVGAVVPIRRREWAEEFTYFKDGKQKKAVKVYADVVLLARGCVVGEAIGDAIYYPDNAKSNYSDALESAKSNAFRRCCKEFGVGLQAWMKGWCEGWKARQRPQGRSGGYPQPTQARNAAPAASQQAKNPAKSDDVLPADVPSPEADRDQKFRFLAALSAIRTQAIEYFVKKGWVAQGQTLDDLPLRHVPKTKREYDSIMAELQAWMDGDGEADEFWWKKVTVPFGAQQGTPIEELDKKKLFGWCKNYQPEESYEGVRKSDGEIAVLKKFREALDEAEKYYFSDR